jgi:alkylated DNA repair dioxygenase AlkB
MQQLSLLEEKDPPPVQYWHWPGFLDSVEADRLFQESQTLAWVHNQLPILGKLVPLPRLELMFGDSENYRYTYSGSVDFKAKPWPPFLADVRTKVEALTGYHYQVGVGNLYRSGQDSIGYHADDEPSLGQQPAIASLSLGAIRTFRLKRKSGGPSRRFIVDAAWMPRKLGSCPAQNREVLWNQDQLDISPLCQKGKCRRDRAIGAY